MSAQLIRTVHQLAETLMLSAEQNNEERFYSYYEQLKQLCLAHKNKKSDHPVLWETLADFSEENAEAIEYYRAAYELADTLKENEYKASIMFALAQRLIEEKREGEARECLAKAEKFAGFTEDEELKQEVKALLAELN